MCQLRIIITWRTTLGLIYRIIKSRLQSQTFSNASYYYEKLLVNDAYTHVETSRGIYIKIYTVCLSQKIIYI